MNLKFTTMNNFFKNIRFEHLGTSIFIELRRFVHHGAIIHSFDGTTGTSG